QAAAVLLVTVFAAAVIGITRLNYDEFALVRRGLVLKIYDAPVLKRALFPVFFDIGIVAASIYMAIVLKTDDWGVVSHRMLALQLLEILPIVTIAVFWAFRLYRGSWRNASIADFLRSSSAVVASAVLGALVCAVALRKPPKLTLLAIEALILLFLVNGSRLSYRLFSHWNLRAAREGEPVLLYGAGLGGTLALREILSNPSWGMRPVGFLDDDPDRAGREVNGYPVIGTLSALRDVIAKREIRTVVVSSAKIDLEHLAELERICRAAGIRVSKFRIEFVEMEPVRSLEKV
ncbi:MAG: nucleoside-diphosphate sugar epimerase/dehydratase, partial [Thermoanaerobaculia bacterium]